MNTPAKIIGIDLDNTIVCYDLAFHHAALDRGWINAETPRAKTAVKQAVLKSAGALAWTELQGHVYGPGIDAATPYPGVSDFFHACAACGIRPVIISHKTAFAAAGLRHNLRKAAQAWLEKSGLLDSCRLVIFTDTRVAKLAEVKRLGCAALIDDLPDVFREPAYPRETEFILFDPDNAHPSWTATPRAASWREITTRFFP